MQVLLAVAILTSATPVEKFQRAESLMNQKKYGEARSIYQSLTKSLPGYRNEMRFRVAECDFNMGDYNKARKELESLLKDVTGTYLEPEVKLLLGYTQLLLGNFNTAENYLTEVDQNPNYKNKPRVRTALGLLYYRKQKLEEAMEKLEGLTSPISQILLARSYTMLNRPLDALALYKKLYPYFRGTQVDFLVIYGMIETLFSSEDYKGVIYEARNFLNTHPADYPLRDHVQFYLGLAYYYLEDYTKALDQFTDLLKRRRFEFSPHAAYFSGNIKLALGKPEEALEYYQTARANANNVLLSAITFIKLAEVFLDMNKPEQAYLTASQLQKLFILEELNGIGDYIYGAISFRLGDYTDAYQRFQNLIERYENSPFTMPAITMTLVAMGKVNAWDLAITFGNMMRSSFEGINSLWADWFRLVLAEANYHQGNYSIAEEIYTKVAQSAQERTLITRANVGLGWCYVHENRNEEAIALLGAMANLGAAASDTNLVIQSYYGMGVAKFNSGKFKEAWNDFTAIVNTYPEKHDVLPDILYFQGLSALALKAYGNALTPWEQLVSDYPDHPRAAKAALRSGEIYRKAGKYEESNTKYMWVMEHFPGTSEAAEAQFFYGQNLYFMKDYSSAIVELEKFVNLYPDHDLRDLAEETIQYAYFYLSQQQPEKLDEFLAKYPTSDLAAKAEFARAVDVFNAGKKEEAADLFLKFAINHPQDENAPRALLTAGQIYYQSKKYPDAIVALKKFVSYYSDRSETDTAVYFLGLSYFKSGQYRDAITTLDPLTQDTRAFKAQALVLVASSYESLGELKKAVSYYIKSADYLLEQGKQEDALRYYKYAYNLAPDPQIKKELELKVANLVNTKEQGG